MEFESSTDKYRRLVAEAQKHPAFAKTESIAALELITSAVVGANLSELLELLSAFEQPGPWSMVLMSNTPVYRAQKLQLIGLIVRQLHNFLNGASSLVDHTRRMLKTRDEHDPIKGRLMDGVRDLQVDGAWPFLKDLRNLTQHHRVPFIGHTTNLVQVGDSGGLGSTSRVELSRSDLLAWGGWKAPARRYLTALDEEIHLLSTVLSCGPAFVDLHIQLITDLRIENADGVNEYNDLITKATAVLFNDDENEAFAYLNGQWTPPTGDASS